MTPEQIYRAQLFEHAWTYVSRGWSVAPLRQVDYYWSETKDRETGMVRPKLAKRIIPLIRWKNDKPLDTLEEVQRWFGTGGPDVVFGLALITGPSGLLMYDEDSYKEAFGAAAEIPAGAWIEAGGGRGGRHIYLSNPDGLRNTAGKVAGGVDTRGVGGLSVAAPTWTFFPDGSATQWRTTWPIAQLPHPSQLPPPPTAVTEASKSTPTHARTGANTAVRAQYTSTPGTPMIVDRRRAAELVTQAHAEWLDVAQGSGLHTATLSFLGVLLRYLFATGVTDDDIRDEVVVWLEQHDDWAGSIEGWDSLPSLLEWSLEAAQAEPWQLDDDWKETFRRRDAARAVVAASPETLSAVLAQCTRLGHPTHRIQLKGRLAQLERISEAFRRDGWDTEARAAWASALAGDIAGEFALDALTIAWHRLALGTEDEGRRAVLAQLGAVITHYTKDEVPA
ncbi:bifunctional DNA primase/polymerase [Amycolatopsis sp. NPDC051371]|uniref:bifunctional DNA primase/polymerase n=1 Tax=Amycolatopsis sp. NPDC051371 TaxID=3155800 RepID=UPI003437B450